VLGLLVVALCVGGVALAGEGGAVPPVASAGGAPDAVAVAPAAGASADLSCSRTAEWTAPERGSVGLPPGLALCPQNPDGGGPTLVDVPGAVIDGWDLRGGLLVTAPGVVVQRSRITGDGSTDHGVATSGAGSVRVQDTTLTGRFAQAALGGAHWTAERVEVVGVAGDGAHAGAGCRLIASALSRFEPGGDTDGVAVRAGDVVVEGTTVRMGAGHRSAVSVAPEEDGPDEGAVVLRGNVLGGGEWTVLMQDPAAADVELVDNRFARDAGTAPLRVPPQVRERGSAYVDGAPVARG
jgi:hypothetical protein